MGRRKSKADLFTQPKVMLATKEDITTSYIQRMNKLGYVMLVIAIPDEEAHGKGSSEHIGIYGNIPDIDRQIAILREIANKIENSIDSRHDKLIRTDN
jgi:hypothetical protein